MDRNIRIARELVRIARDLVAKELVIIPFGGNDDRFVESGDDNSNIGNKTDRSFPYEIWAIDLKSMDEASPEFKKVSNLIRDIQRNPNKRWILWTSKNNVEGLMPFCERNGFVPDAVNDNVKEVRDYYGANSRKVYAHHYVDMRNIGIDSVSDAMKSREDGKKTVYAIDFDGTIAETDRTFPQVERANDNIVDFIKNVIQPDPSKEWVLYTCRVGEPERMAEQWCYDNGLYPVAVNSNARNHGDRKINADYYIDDRNVDLSSMV